MGERYLITGVQIGLLQVCLKNKDLRGLKTILKQVEEQLVAVSKNTLISDIQQCQKALEESNV